MGSKDQIQPISNASSHALVSRFSALPRLPIAAEAEQARTSTALQSSSLPSAEQSSNTKSGCSSVGFGLSPSLGALSASILFGSGVAGKGCQKLSRSRLVYLGTKYSSRVVSVIPNLCSRSAE